MGIIYCYHDMFSWGPELAANVQRLKGSAQMMTHAVQVEDEVGTAAFIHVSDRERQYTQELAAVIGEKHNVLMVPSAREIALHDDMLAQYEEFGHWMPTTWILQSMEQTEAVINDLPYPIVSSTRSKVLKDQRVLADPEQAFTEAGAVFGEQGLQLASGRNQKGYLVWQPTYEISGVRWHVFILGKRYAVITETSMGVDPAQPGAAFQVIDVLKPQHIGLLDFVRGFAEEEHLDWACVEVTATKSEDVGTFVPFVTGYSVSWPMAWFERGGMIFESDCGMPWQSIGIPAVKIWQVVAEWMMAKLAK